MQRFQANSHWDVTLAEVVFDLYVDINTAPTPHPLALDGSARGVAVTCLDWSGGKSGRENGKFSIFQILRESDWSSNGSVPRPLEDRIG